MRRVVRRLQVVHTQRTDAVLLDDRFLGSPAEMMNRCRHLEDAAGRQHISFAEFCFVPESHVEAARDDGHRHFDGMPVRGYPVVRGELQAYREWPRLGKRPFDHGHAGSRRQHRRTGCPLELGWREPYHLLGRGAASGGGLWFLCSSRDAGGQNSRDDTGHFCCCPPHRLHLTPSWVLVMLSQICEEGVRLSVTSVTEVNLSQSRS